MIRAARDRPPVCRNANNGAREPAPGQLDCSPAAEFRTRGKDREGYRGTGKWPMPGHFAGQRARQAHPRLCGPGLSTVDFEVKAKPIRPDWPTREKKRRGLLAKFRRARLRVLIVEDDPNLGQATAQGLELEGFAVELRNGGEGANAALIAQQFDVIVLDLMLPDTSGEDLLRSWRERADDTPVLVLTARGFVLDRVRLLNLGADDYLIKPFDLLELSARLRALGRRQGGKDKATLEYGSLLLSRSEHVVMWSGMRIELTKREYRILESLLRNRDRVLSRRQMEETLYGFGEEIESNAIEVHVHNLRRKLSRGLIETVRGSGYRLNPNAQPD
jgi:DNA-binding response OmpR family regulator